MNSVALPASPTGAGLFLVINPRSGRTKRRPDPRPLLTAELPDAIIHTLAEGESPSDVLRAAVASPTRPTILGVYGGDGSVGAGAEVALESGLPLLVLPGGTLNHFAITVGISDLATGIAAVQQGSGSAVDLAEIDFGDRGKVLAINTLNVGVYPSFVRFRAKMEPAVGRPIATMVAAVRAVFTAAPFEITLNGENIHVWTAFIGVDRYVPARGGPLKRQGFDDGLLDVRILRSTARSRGQGFFSLLRRSRRRHSQGSDPMFLLPPQLVTFTQTEVTLRSTTGEGQVFAHDGEVEAVPQPAKNGSRTVTVRVIPGAVRIYRQVSQ